ncbi:hypothetical protein QYF61_005300 [Mycteria americana]|uniref:Keratin n=1 Tax=Mycteria americana TaxID=33587 RepID=A0AAN7NAJ5_MYCAM|nr:hypothetical protein QYF61_005300 [Mycteria americana]
MACYSPCLPAACGPTPLANSCNEPCVIRCADSSVAIQPSPVLVTLPGPILSSFPQSTAVGSTASAASIKSCRRQKQELELELELELEQEQEQEQEQQEQEQQNEEQLQPQWQQRQEQQ